MPEFNFRLSNSEITDVFRYIFEQGTYMIPDMFYPSANGLLLRSPDELADYAKGNAPLKLNILRDDYIECPLFFRNIIKDNQKVYYISDRYGGPTLLFLWFELVNKGHCFYYPYYFYEEVDYYKHRPPEALVRLYKDIFSYIRKKSKIVKYYNRRIYCGREYLEQVLDGTIRDVDDEFKVLVEEQFNDRLDKGGDAT